jgi:GTP cyclohydrolase IB
MSLKDTQNERDHRNIAIDRVGVRSLRFPLRIRDRDQQEQHTVAMVSLAVDLPHQYKGTHMSRFVEALHAHGQVIDVKGITGLPRELLSRLNADSAHVEFRFPYFRSKAAPVTKVRGLLDYGVVFEVNAKTDARIDFVLTVEVPVATLCPCSKAISDRGAHNQRGMVTFSVRFDQPIWIEDLIELVEGSASCELYSEKYVTEAAYDNPVFVEDLVRNVAQKAKKHPHVLWFRVEAENFESIHNHNAYAMIEQRVREP